MGKLSDRTETTDVTTGSWFHVAKKIGSVFTSFKITKENLKTELGIPPALGFTPENVANKAVTMTGNDASDIIYLSAKAVYTWALNLFTQRITPITPNTKTKITYNALGQVLSGADATTSDINDTPTRRYTSDAEKATWNALIGGSIFQTTWNASTNTPTLTSSSGTKGFYYIVTTNGTTNLNGITDWKIGDWAIFDGIVWRKVDNTDAVISWNSRVGVIVPEAGDYNTDQINEKPDFRFQTDFQKLYNDATSSIQGQLNSKQPNLGFTPANKAGDTFTGAIAATNLSGTNTGDETTTTIAGKIIDDVNVLLNKTYSSQKIENIRNEIYATNLIMS
jgi:hypothetical protein